MAIHVMFSVDWEGTSLLKDNLLAMQSLNARFPHIPCIQFLNPAYFIPSMNWQTERAKELIQLALSDKDELGLHIHSWQRLIEAAGIPYRSQPSFFDGQESLAWMGEYGGDVPITSYSREEFDQLVKFSLKILKEQGFNNLNSFRAGGWCANDKIYEVLLNNNITSDSSPVPAQLVAQKYPDTFLYDYCQRQWLQINQLSQPYSQKVSGGNIQVFPNNVCLADYVDFDQALEIFESIVKAAKDNKVEHTYFHYGWHQETLCLAHRRQEDGEFKLEDSGYLSRVEKVMAYLTKLSKDSKYEIEFTTIRDYKRPPRLN